MTTRRTFLASLGVAAVAPAAIGRAVAAKSPDRIISSASDTERRQAIAIWGRQYSWKGNPAWVMYDMMVAKYGVDAVDRESAARMAAYGDEPVGTTL